MAIGKGELTVVMDQKLMSVNDVSKQTLVSFETLKRLDDGITVREETLRKVISGLGYSVENHPFTVKIDNAS
jgi:hypothetical protein